MARWAPLLFLIFCSKLILATSIIPYRNLSILAKHSDASGVYRVVDYFAVQDGEITRYKYLVQPVEAINGPTTGTLSIRCLAKATVNGDFYVPDDLFLEVGHHYLLFLEKTDGTDYLPKVINYYVYEQIIKDGLKLLVPNEDTRKIKGNAERPIEPISTLAQDALVGHLHQVLTKHLTYLPEIVRAPASYQSLEQRDAPAYCDYYGLRWDVFDTGGSLPVYADSDPDQYNAGCYTFLDNAIQGMNTGYNGNVSLYADGTFNTNNSICDGGEVNTVAQDVVPVSIQIVFNDPCNQIGTFDCEISDGSIGGPLGIGGIKTSSGVHDFNGQSWYTAAYGYVVINDGLSCFNDAGAWQSLLMHEMTHALGLGHISPSDGVALMNPSCCNDITSLDQNCINFEYNASLPVQLIRFDADAIPDEVQLHWETAYEFNHDYFELMRSKDGITWEPLTRVSEGIVVDENRKIYHKPDRHPYLGTNYYQLNQVDIDGASTLSHIVQVDYYPAHFVQIYPNPNQGQPLQLVFSSSSANVVVQIIDVTGHILLTRQVAVINHIGQVQIATNHWGSGIYLLRFPKSEDLKPVRFIKQ
ncbi:MAG: T9SS type A sorting domain-containing protein [Saprospiraceae bacterium]|nr:T9SS type A sorting domain-containing protein [Saprospiraceae bacterium]